MAALARLRSGLIAIVWALTPVALAADKLEVPYLSSPVVDEAGLLDARSTAAIERALRSMHERGRFQMAVYVPRSLHELTIEEFSIRVAETWKLGRKGTDKGLLLVIAPNERQMRLEVGYGLEGEITDAFSKQITAGLLRAYFREQRYGDGVLEAIRRISAKLGVQVDAPPVAPPRMATAKPGWVERWFVVIFVLLVLGPFFFFGLLMRLGRKRGLRWNHGGWSVGGWGGGGGGWGGGGFGGGGGGFGGGGASSSW